MPRAEMSNEDIGLALQINNDEKEIPITGDQQTNNDKEAYSELLKKHYILVTQTKRDTIGFLKTWSEFLSETGRTAGQEGWKFIPNQSGFDHVPGLQTTEGIEPSEETFYQFANWMLRNRKKANLDKFTVALNTAHAKVFLRPKEEKPWSRPEIKDIKKAYLNARLEIKALHDKAISKRKPKSKSAQKRANVERKNEPLLETEIIRILEIAEDEERREKVHLELSKPPDFLLWSAVVLLNFITATRPHSIGLHQSGNEEGLQDDVEFGEDELIVMIRGFKAKSSIGKVSTIAKGSRFESMCRIPELFSIPRGKDGDLRQRMISVITEASAKRKFELLGDMNGQNAHSLMTSFLTDIRAQDCKGRPATSYSIRVLAVSALRNQVEKQEGTTGDFHGKDEIDAVVSLYTRWTNPTMIKTYHREYLDTSKVEAAFDFVADSVLQKFRDTQKRIEENQSRRDQE